MTEPAAARQSAISAYLTADQVGELLQLSTKTVYRLVKADPQRAKVEILKHLDGDLVIVPRPSITGERRAEISGRAKSDSLLRDQEAVCLQVVAGVGFEPTTFGL